MLDYFRLALQATTSGAWMGARLKRIISRQTSSKASSCHQRRFTAYRYCALRLILCSVQYGCSSHASLFVNDVRQIGTNALEVDVGETETYMSCCLGGDVEREHCARRCQAQLHGTLSPLRDVCEIQPGLRRIVPALCISSDMMIC